MAIWKCSVCGYEKKASANRKNAQNAAVLVLLRKRRLELF